MELLPGLLYNRREVFAEVAEVKTISRITLSIIDFGTWNVQEVQ